MGLLMLLLASVAGGGEIHFNIEEPVAGAVHAGIGNLRGWAVSSSGVARVELYMDGELETTVPSGGSRNDVPRLYPNYPEADRSGFSMAYSYSKLEPGTHRVTIRVVDKDGDWEERSVEFEAQRFFDHFVKAPDAVDGSDAEISVEGDCLRLNGLRVEGSAFDTRLCWNAPAQGMTFSRIASTSEGGDGGSGSGDCVTLPAATGRSVVLRENEYENGMLVSENTTYIEYQEDSAQLLEYTIRIEGMDHAPDSAYGSEGTMSHFRHLEGDWLYTDRVRVSGSSYEEGESYEGRMETRYEPALLEGPFRTYCAGQAWEVPEVVATLVDLDSGLQWRSREGGYRREVVSVGEQVRVPAGTFTTLHLRETGPYEDGSYTADYWIDLASGVMIREVDADPDSTSEIEAQKLD